MKILTKEPSSRAVKAVLVGSKKEGRIYSLLQG